MDRRLLRPGRAIECPRVAVEARARAIVTAVEEDSLCARVVRNGRIGASCRMSGGCELGPGRAVERPCLAECGRAVVAAEQDELADGGVVDEVRLVAVSYTHLP